MSSTYKSIHCPRGARAAQRGIVLVLALIFLLLLTIIAVAASGRSLLQQRMAGGLLNAQRAEMSAQTALRGAEWKLFSGSSTSGINCGGSEFPSCYKYSARNSYVENFRTKPGLITLGSTEYRALNGSIDYTATVNGKLADNPRYIIESMDLILPSGPQAEGGQTGPENPGPETRMYRITARATGGDKNTTVVLESTFNGSP